MTCAAKPSDDPVRGWPRISHGTAVTVIKLAPDGAEVARYPATVRDDVVPAPWLAVEAQWVTRRVEMDGLAFEPGDTLREYFSPRHRFNAFAVVTPDGLLRGWYANVTHPPRLDADAEPPILTWHDLYVDVVALPDGRTAVRDEDELAEAALGDREPALHATILAARDEILDRLECRVFPFHDLAGGGHDAVAIGGRG